MEKKNIISIIFETVKRRGSAPCLRSKKDGKWTSISYDEFYNQVLAIAATLKEFGLSRGERVVILSSTRPEFTMLDCAIMAAGGVVLPIYPSITPAKMAEILTSSTPDIAVIENAVLEGKFDEALRESSHKEVKKILIDDAGENGLLKLAVSQDAKRCEDILKIVAALEASDEATYVYTSGTMGEQKGVVITHANVIGEILGAHAVFDFREDEVGLLCLPLAHVLGRLMQFYCLVRGCEMAYVESVERLGENYMEVRPNFLCVVPRMLEKIYELVEVYLSGIGHTKRKLFDWAMGVGLSHSSFKRKYKRYPYFLSIGYQIAYLMLFRKLKKKLGGRIRTFICGGAPLKEEIAKLLHAAGIQVLEGYGLTETFAAVTVNRPNDYRFGTVGKPIPGVEVKLAGDREILVRGTTVFKEYKNMPEATKDSFDENGWFKTGDLGEFSRDGFLRIVGRKKEIIVTAGGKNISPHMIEALMSKSPFVRNFVVYGDGKKFLTGIVSLNRDALVTHFEKEGIEIPHGAKLEVMKPVRDLIEKHVSEANKELASYETIKRFAITDNEFSVATGELTPTMKVRRNFVIDKYKGVLEGLYG